MSWEPAEEWPDGRSGGVFRGAAEVVLATREAPRWRDRLRLWWHSTPDHPFAAIPLRAAITPSWIYVETRGGKRRRARLEQLVGSRREAGRVIYAITEGDDLVLADRGGDAFERALDERLASQPTRWRSPSARVAVSIAALVMLGISLAVTWSYRDEAMARIAQGLTTSESALGLYAGLGGVLLTLLFVTFFPRRYVADSLGITSVRGLFGWVRSTTPAERVRAVRVHRLHSRAKSGVWVTYTVSVVCEGDTLRVHSGKPVKPVETAAVQQEALGIARQVARIFEVEIEDRSAR